jgi:hypothetical protein
MVGGKSVFRSAVAVLPGRMTLSMLVLNSLDPTRQELLTRTSSVRTGSVNPHTSRGLIVGVVEMVVGEV